MAVVLALVLVAVGSVVFHLVSPWWWTPIASNWRYIDETIIVTFWITGVVFVAVVLFMAYCVFRFRHREGRRAAFEPENKKLEWWLTIATAVGVAAMLAPGLFVWNQFVTVPADATEIEIVAPPWRTGSWAPPTSATSIPTTRSASTRTTPTGRTTSCSKPRTCTCRSASR